MIKAKKKNEALGGIGMWSKAGRQEAERYMVFTIMAAKEKNKKKPKKKKEHKTN
jgi:hypothetical protein